MRTTLAVSTTTFALSLLLLAAPGTSRADNLFVSFEGNNTIEEFDANGVGTVFATASSGLAGPEGLAFDASGNLYVANCFNFTTYYCTIEKFNSSGVGTVFASRLPPPSGLALDGSDNLYAALFDESIKRFSSLGVGTVFASGVNAQPLAFDSRGNLYVGTAGFGSQILKFNSSGVGTVFAGGLDDPTGLAFDSAGNLYVTTGEGNGIIEEFNTNGVGTVFATGLSYPTGLAFDCAGNLFAGEEGNGTIEEYNTNGVGTVFASGLTGDPWGLAIQPVPEPSTWAMFAMGIGAILGGLRIRRKNMKTSLAVSTTSFAMILLLLLAPGTSRADNLFVANAGNNTIDEINSSGTVTVFASTGVDDPSSGGLAFDSAGNLYVSNYGNDTIEEFNSSGVGTVFASGVPFPQGLAFDSKGNLFVANNGSDITEFNPSGVGTFFASPGHFSSPIGLTFDNNGNLYVANQSEPGPIPTIEEFNTNGVGTVFASTGMADPTGLTFDKNGNLYVANAWDANVVFRPWDAQTNTIVEFNTNGVPTLFARGVDTPCGLAFDNNGNLYVSNAGNGIIEEFGTNGVGTVFASGLDEPTGLAFQPVPEPSTWAMVAMGIGVVFGGLRLHRRSS